MIPVADAIQVVNLSCRIVLMRSNEHDTWETPGIKTDDAIWVPCPGSCCREPRNLCYAPPDKKYSISRLDKAMKKMVPFPVFFLKYVKKMVEKYAFF